MRSLDRTDVPTHSPGPLVDLPSPSTKHWGFKRKAMVVSAVRNGYMSLQEACTRYKLSVEEFLAWERSFDRYGVPGLRVTRLQTYRLADTLLAKHEPKNPKKLVCCRGMKGVRHELRHAVQLRER